MQLKSSLLVALVAGSAASVAMGQMRPLPVGPIQQGPHIKSVTVNGHRVPQNGNGTAGDVPAVVYDTGPLVYYYPNPLGSWGENAVMNPGPGTGGPVTVTSLEGVYALAYGSPAGFAGGTVDYVIDIYDTYTNPPAIATDPVNTVPIYQIVVGPVTLPAITTPGAGYVFNPIDLTGLAPPLVLPDNNFFYHARWCPTGTTNADLTLGCGMSGAVNTVGASDNTFMWDVNHDNIFLTGETYQFGTAPNTLPINNMLKLQGNFTGPTGACCLPDSTCEIISNAYCTQRGGTYQGDGSACGSCGPAPTGRCCKPNGTCAVISNFDCTAAHGVYGGNNTTCAAACTPFGYDEAGVDVGDLPGTAAVVSGPGNTALTNIYGALTAGDIDMFQINICDRTVFTASCVGGAAGADTQMFLFDSTGKGLAMDDDNAAGAESNVSGAFVVANGVHYVAIGFYNRDPIDAAAVQIWANTNPSAAFFPEWAPNGVPASATNIVAGWTGSPATTGNYNITLTGACFVAAGCYANCDGSTAVPLLTANDFQCFLNKYAQNDLPYANCDGSTAVPLLTANDFQCFLNAYAAGCP